MLKKLFFLYFPKCLTPISAISQKIIREALAAAVEEVDQERAQMEGEAKALRTEVAQLVKECERIDGVKASKASRTHFLPISHMSWLPICHSSLSPAVDPRFPHVSPGMSDVM